MARVRLLDVLKCRHGLSWHYDHEGKEYLCHDVALELAPGCLDNKYDIAELARVQQWLNRQHAALSPVGQAILEALTREDEWAEYVPSNPVWIARGERDFIGRAMEHLEMCGWDGEDQEEHIGHAVACLGLWLEEQR